MIIIILEKLSIQNMTNVDQRFLLLWNSESVAATPFCCMRCPTFFFSFLHHEHQHHLCQCFYHYCPNLFKPWLSFHCPHFS